MSIRSMATLPSKINPKIHLSLTLNLEKCLISVTFLEQVLELVLEIIALNRKNRPIQGKSL